MPLAAFLNKDVPTHSTPKLNYYNTILIIIPSSPDHWGPFGGFCPAKRRVTSLMMLGQGMCLGCGFSHQSGAYESQLINVSLSHLCFSLFSFLSSPLSKIIIIIITHYCTKPIEPLFALFSLFRDNIWFYKV